MVQQEAEEESLVPMLLFSHMSQAMRTRHQHRVRPQAALKLQQAASLVQIASLPFQE